MSDPFVHEIVIAAPDRGEDRWRAEALVDVRPRTVTSHLWLRLDPAGPAVADPSADDGCGVTTDADGGRRPPLVLALAGPVALAVRLRRRRRGG